MPKVVALLDIAANPALFDGQVVSVKGFVTLEREDYVVCSERQNGRCLWLFLPSDESNFGEFDGRRCRVIGRVAASESGGMVPLPASLHVIRMDEVAVD